VTLGGQGPRVFITGTPGVGKTTQCKRLAPLLHTECISLGEALLSSPYVKYVPHLDTYEIVDMERAKRYVKPLLSKGRVLETHVVELVDDVDVVFVLRKAPDVLYAELAKRGWPTRKVVENVWAEMLDVVYVAARERWGKVFQIDVTRRSPEETSALLMKCLSGECVDEKVDWLSYAERSGFLDFIERLSRSEGLS